MRCFISGILLVFILFFAVPTMAESTSYALKTGFNFIGVSRDAGGLTSTSLLQEHAAIDQIFHFDAATQNFVFQLRLEGDTYFGSGFVLNAGEGYIIRCQSPMNLEISGDFVNSNPMLSLSAGFNLVCLDSLFQTSTLSASTLLQVYPGIKSLFTWNTSNQAFQFFLRLNTGQFFGEDLSLVPGESQFINYSPPGTTITDDSSETILVNKLQDLLQRFNVAYNNSTTNIIEINRLTAELNVLDSQERTTSEIDLEFDQAYDHLYNLLEIETLKFQLNSQNMDELESQIQELILLNNPTQMIASYIPQIPELRAAIFILPIVKIALIAISFTGFAGFLAEKQKEGQKQRALREAARADLADPDIDVAEAEARYLEANSKYQKTGRDVITELTTKVTVDMVSTGSPINTDSLFGVVLNETAKEALSGEVKRITSINQNKEIVISEVRSDGSFNVAPGETSFIICGGEVGRETFSFDADVPAGGSVENFDWIFKEIEDTGLEDIRPADPADPDSGDGTDDGSSDGTDDGDPADSDSGDGSDDGDPDDSVSDEDTWENTAEVEIVQFNYLTVNQASLDDVRSFAGEVETFLDSAKGFARQPWQTVFSGTELTTEVFPAGTPFGNSQSSFSRGYVKTGTRILHGPTELYRDEARQQLSAKLFFVNGKLEGVQEAWVTNGIFTDGQLVGYEEPFKWKEYFYVDGKREGMQRDYDYTNQYLLLRMYSADNLVDGVWIYAFMVDDKLYPYKAESRKSYDSMNGTLHGYTVQWGPYGLLRFLPLPLAERYPLNFYTYDSTSSSTSHRSGLQGSFFASGNIDSLWSEIQNPANPIWSLKHGLYREYFDDPQQLKEEGEYQNGQKEGEWKTWLSSGELSKTGNYAAGLKQGLFKEYYSSGELRYEENWDNNLRDGIAKEYYENRNLKRAGTYSAGQMSGTWTYYNEDGSIQTTVDY